MLCSIRGVTEICGNAYHHQNYFENFQSVKFSDRQKKIQDIQTRVIFVASLYKKKKYNHLPLI